MTAEHGADGTTLQATKHLLFLALVESLDLHATRGRRREKCKVGDARHRQRLAETGGAAHRVACEVLDVRDGHAHRHTRRLRDVRTSASEVSELGDDLLHKGGKDELEVLRHRMTLGLHDLHLFADAQRIVRSYLRAEAILERRDDAAARRVVLGVRAGDDEQIEREPYAISPDLDVLLPRDGEQVAVSALRES